MTASVVHGLRRKLRDGVVERTDAASTAATSRAAAVTSGPKMRAASSMAWARGCARYAVLQARPSTRARACQVAMHWGLDFY
jgi:hypothetical protein